MDFKGLYIAGTVSLQEAKKNSDAEREYGYRGGNAGILKNGIPSNSCARKALARAKGRSEEIAWNTQLMFDMGELNEIRWLDKLRAAGLTVEQADNYVSAKTKGGTPITGSPDTLVLTSDKGVEYLIEHKHVSSFWSFRDVFIEGKPKLENLAQAGFYSLHIDKTPACVLYSSSTLFSGPSFLTNLVPHPTAEGSENFDYTYYKYTGKTRKYKGKEIKEKSKIAVPGHMNSYYPSMLFTELGADFAEFKNTLPSIIQYDILWKDGVLNYQKHGADKWIPSIITEENLLGFYDYMEECDKSETVPKRPASIDIKGESKNYTLCNYCSLSDVCDKYEKDFKKWLKEAKEVTW